LAGGDAPIPVTRRTRRGNDSLSAAASAAPDEARADTLTVQQALLDRARSALAHGDGGQALTALSEHARVHPTSELAEEREALTIKALITSGDIAAARKRAADFGVRYPRSLFLSSIRAALAKNP
jgi:outer membrane protein assembly factor BamD (BamD/ComL family)